MKKVMVAFLLLVALIFTACTALARPTPTPVPTPTFTPVPTRTATRTPTRTPAPTDTPAAATEWEGIPIMPGAIAGEGDEESYVFTIQATPQQVQEYYELELGKRGWTASAEAAGEASLILAFMEEASMVLTVNIIAKGDESLVLLVK